MSNTFTKEDYSESKDKDRRLINTLNKAKLSALLVTSFIIFSAWASEHAQAKYKEENYHGQILNCKAKKHWIDQ